MLILGQEVRRNLEEFRVGGGGSLGRYLDGVYTSSTFRKNYSIIFMRKNLVSGSVFNVKVVLLQLV